MVMNPAITMATPTVIPKLIPKLIPKNDELRQPVPCPSNS
jgi:hypothetical protein